MNFLFAMAFGFAFCSLALRLGRPFRFRFFVLHPLGKFGEARLAVPFFECLIRDLALEQELREFATLCLAFEGHDVPT